VRQPQVRYTSGGLSLSAENRETTITPYKGGSRITSDDGAGCGPHARYADTSGTVALAGMLRELVHETTGTGAIDDSTWTGALSLSGKFVFGKDDVRWMGMYGNLGRYVGLNFANDAVLDGSGDLDGIDGWAGRCLPPLLDERWRSTFSVAMQDYDNDVDLTGGLAAKSSWSWSANVFYSPLRS